MVGKKVETPNKAVGPRAALAPQAPRPSAGAVQSEPPMDVDPTELIPTIPPAGRPALANQAPVAIDDVDLEDDDDETLMFKRPEPRGPPRRPPPPKTRPAAPAKPGARPLPPPRSDKSILASPKVVDRPVAPPPKLAAKPPPIKVEPNKPPALKVEPKPLLAMPTVNESPSVAPNPSEPPLFEVTLGSEKPLHGTPEAGEISLLAPKSPNMPLLAAPHAGDLGSLDRKVGGISPMLALPMLDFSRDVAGLNRSSPPGVATRVVGFARARAKWLVMTGGAVLIVTVSWAVFHAAAAGSETASGSARATPGAHTLSASPAQATATVQPTAAPATAQPVAAADPDPVAPAATEPAPVEKNGLAEALAAAAAATAATAPAAEQTGSAAEAVRPAAAAPAPQAPAAERPERAAPVATVETAPRPSGSRGTSSRPESTELPAAKPAPEPVAAPAPVAPPSAGGFDGTADFDQSAAMAALRQAAESAKRCPATDAPSGGVRIAVTFARTGTVSATQVEGAVAGTPLGDCVVAKFQNVHVPPFRGSVMTVRKTVMF